MHAAARAIIDNLCSDAPKEADAATDREVCIRSVKLADVHVAARPCRSRAGRQEIEDPVFGKVLVLIQYQNIIQILLDVYMVNTIYLILVKQN